MHVSNCLSRVFALSIVITILLTSIITTPSKIFAQNEPIIQSDSAILMDAKTGTILYQKNMNKKQYPASITKIMTALLAIENGDLNDTITFSRNAVYSIERGSSHIGMREGEQISLKNALYGMLLMSANEVANAIAEHIDGTVDKFSEHMNEKAKELGALNTHFVNPHGLHDENHYTTAYDMALIAREALKFDAYREIIGTTTYTIPPTNLVDEPRYLAHQHKLFNIKKYPSLHYEGCEGGKTGFTDQAQHTLVTYAKRNNLELIVVVLNSGRQSMYDDSRTLLDYGFDNYEMVPLIKKDTLVTTVPTVSMTDDQKSYQENTKVYTQTDFSYVFSKEEQKHNVIKEISIPKVLVLPINKNEVVGTFNFIYKNKIIGQVNLITKESIDWVEPVLANKINNKVPSPITDNKIIRILIMIVSTIGVLIALFFILSLINSYCKKHKRTNYYPKNKLHLPKYLDKK